MVDRLKQQGAMLLLILLVAAAAIEISMQGKTYIHIAIALGAIVVTLGMLYSFTTSIIGRDKETQAE